MNKKISNTWLVHLDKNRQDGRMFSRNWLRACYQFNNRRPIMRTRKGFWWRDFRM